MAFVVHVRYCILVRRSPRTYDVPLWVVLFTMLFVLHTLISSLLFRPSNALPFQSRVYIRGYSFTVRVSPVVFDQPPSSPYSYQAQVSAA
ncbi:hypothetical protein FA13DRAFT_58742 [Coprinellus micaceus]|uniref:Uncharacterized protein n=1 Tax=Coprinellus micaceus TaxID=71717 RepID=A0A4Y7U1M9_COPMI|nr:hypothetical protein FA13DRAFT_58742 [Coprinellus micaceus]